MEAREFIYGVEDKPSWFENYVEKIEVNHRGFMACYVYSPYDKKNCQVKIFRTNDVIRHEDLYELW